MRTPTENEKRSQGFFGHFCLGSVVVNQEETYKEEHACVTNGGLLWTCGIDFEIAVGHK